ncbi:B12-binding domain-containing radical SAM protein [Clostridium polyendosporum]|uniref:B12-binding domain-containing radical SAM protein n=1 Tax=Clostridium polyendosporum TaxID=69208 RepID=A0A919RZW5_9CLOT|nr:B12-binding domain-containing radical SAM protein [Clostridium polyendosporum]GIM29547.1 B12-binding domain-containing radical SAM protein [Clostridium polyendosporum]
MKVLLTAVNSKYIHSNLAVRYLKQFTSELDYECTIREFSINDRIENILEEIMLEKADVVAFSCYIWNMEYINRLAELIKLVNDKIQILYGGPEVSFDCENFLKEHVGEFLITGEGEETYKEFIEYKLERRKLETIRGLYYKTENDVKFNGFRPQIDMNNLVFPYTMDDNSIENKIVYYEASRGCPFRCKYCLSSTIEGVRFLNVERVKKELKYFMDKGVRLVKFVDRTFNCNHNFAKEIWKYLMEQNTNTTFHFEISADILRDDEIELLSKAPYGRFQFEVGVQTTNDEVLANINRHISFNDIKGRVSKIAQRGNIKQHLDLIAGLPGEDFQSFKKSFNDVHSIGPEEIQLGFLKLLKGSSMREEALKWGIVYSPYAPYEILRSKDISYEELLQLKKAEEMVDKYYNSGKFNNIIKFFNHKFETPFDFYFELGSFFEKKGYFKRNIGNVEYYKVFLDFNEEKLNSENQEALKEIIKYDYLCFNKKKWLPDFLIRDLDKNEERRIKDSIKEQYDSNNYHIEKFRLDINKYISDSGIKFSPSYFIFDVKNPNNIISITEYEQIN